MLTWVINCLQIQAIICQLFDILNFLEGVVDSQSNYMVYLSSYQVCHLNELYKLKAFEYSNILSNIDPEIF